jgi:photosystem II stability/assembly factor-like uncharacterized protein
VIDVTRDGGKTWQKIAPPCGSNQAGEVNAPAATLTAFSAELLSVACTAKNLHPAKITHSVSFSTNGGRAWTQIPAASSEIIRAEPVSSTIGWGTSGAGAILRTTDSGHSWSTVWPANRQGSPVGTLENLAATGLTRAFATFEIDTTKGTYFLIRATTDAGATWSAVAAFTVP